MIHAAELIARTPIDRQVEALTSNEYSVGEAHRLLALLPSAFSRAILEALGVTHFAPLVTATAADGTPVEALLARQPEYVIGLEVARKHRRVGVMDHEAFKHIASGSAEIASISNALNDGIDITGATIATSLIGSEIADHLIL